MQIPIQLTVPGNLPQEFVCHPTSCADDDQSSIKALRPKLAERVENLTMILSRFNGSDDQKQWFRFEGESADALSNRCNVGREIEFGSEIEMGDRDIRGTRIQKSNL